MIKKRFPIHYTVTISSFLLTVQIKPRPLPKLGDAERPGGEGQTCCATCSDWPFYFSALFRFLRTD